ncbi:MAG TPA: hypothetical protein V6C81_24400 [Planktothrix sp.]
MFSWITNLFSGAAKKELEKNIEELTESIANLKTTEDKLVDQIQRADSNIGRAQVGDLGAPKMAREQMLFQLQENRALQKQLQAKMQEYQLELRKLR